MGTANQADDQVEPDSHQVAQLAKQVECDTVVCRVILTNALISDPEDPRAPAHAELHIQRHRIDGRSEVESWLLAESWWAETFLPPSFSDLARWGLRIIPWMVGSHFGAPVRRILARRSEASKGDRLWKQSVFWLLWFGRLVGSVIGLIAALLATPLLLGALAILLLVGLLPIQQVREALLKIQLKVASTLGDSHVLVSRPIEAASIVGQVRRDIYWLASRCKVLVLVAHSQGGAVAHQALQGGVPPKLRILFTFGSGLKKLEELKSLLSSGHSYLRSAVLTLVALLFFGLSSAWFALMLTTKELKTLASHDFVAQVPTMLIYLLLSAVVLYAGLRDHIRGIDLPDLHRWIERLRNKLHWVDCFASVDPVSNGPVIEMPEVESWSVEVCNQSSFLGDHTSYWANRDQFVTLLISQLAHPQLRNEAGLLPADEFLTESRS